MPGNVVDDGNRIARNFGKSLDILLMSVPLNELSGKQIAKSGGQKLNFAVCRRRGWQLCKRCEF
ncbi:MAG: hypothetical protein RLZZ536_3410 [Planctomycetota bacterium]